MRAFNMNKQLVFTGVTALVAAWIAAACAALAPTPSVTPDAVTPAALTAADADDANLLPPSTPPFSTAVLNLKGLKTAA